MTKHVGATLVTSPLMVEGVGSLMQRHRFDRVATQLAGLRLQAWRDVGLQGTVLALDRPNLHFKSRRICLTPGEQRYVQLRCIIIIN